MGCRQAKYKPSELLKCNNCRGGRASLLDWEVVTLFFLHIIIISPLLARAGCFYVGFCVMARLCAGNGLWRPPSFRRRISDGLYRAVRFRGWPAALIRQSMELWFQDSDRAAFAAM